MFLFFVCELAPSPRRNPKQRRHVTHVSALRRAPRRQAQFHARARAQGETTDRRGDGGKRRARVHGCARGRRGECKRRAAGAFECCAALKCAPRDASACARGGAPPPNARCGGTDFWRGSHRCACRKVRPCRAETALLMAHVMEQKRANCARARWFLCRVVPHAASRDQMPSRVDPTQFLVLT